MTTFPDADLEASGRALRVGRTEWSAHKREVNGAKSWI
jgi:hypothetical protein